MPARSTNQKYWTRERVVEGLQRFWRVFHQAPLSSVKVHQLARGHRQGDKNAFPPPGAILSYFRNMYEAWQATGLQEALPKCETCPALVVPEYRADHGRGGGGLRRPKRFCTDCLARNASAKIKEAWARGESRRANRWIPTPEIDEEIRVTYLLTRRSSRVPRIKSLAARIGWPRDAVQRRACELGLRKVKEPDWSDEELALLEKWAFLTPAYIRKRFLAAGFDRSELGIHIKRGRLSLSKERPFYSITQLMPLIGEDSHKIRRWITFGWLVAGFKGTDRKPQQGGDAFLIHDVDVYLFLEKYRDEYDVRKCDQEWLLATLIDFPRARMAEIESRRRELANGTPSEAPEWSSSKWKERVNRKKRGPTKRFASSEAAV